MLYIGFEPNPKSFVRTVIFFFMLQSDENEEDRNEAKKFGIAKCKFVELVERELALSVRYEDLASSSHGSEIVKVTVENIGAFSFQVTEYSRADNFSVIPKDDDGKYWLLFPDKRTSNHATILFLCAMMLCDLAELNIHFRRYAFIDCFVKHSGIIDFRFSVDFQKRVCQSLEYELNVPDGFSIEVKFDEFLMPDFSRFDLDYICVGSDCYVEIDNDVTQLFDKKILDVLKDHLSRNKEKDKCTEAGKCPHCKENFSDAKALEKHLKTNHKKKSWPRE